MILASATALVLAVSANVAPPAKPKPQAQGPKPIVLGTTQLPGDFGKFGTTYTIGKDLPLNFTLLGAEYSMERFLGDDGSGMFGYMPRKDEKLLILKYTVHNPNSRDARLWYGTFNLIGITADDQNINHLNRPSASAGRKYVDLQLKPAQKVAMTAVLRVPAEGELPKLMIQHRFEPKAAVIRYDLKGKVAKLKEGVSDDGFTPKPGFEAALDQWIQFPAHDIKVVSFAKVTSPMDALKLDVTNDQWAAKLTVRGVADQQSRLWYGSLDFSVRTEDGDVLTPKVQDRLLRMSSDQAYDADFPVGEEMSFRLVVDLPKGIKPKELRLAYKRSDELHRTTTIKLPAEGQAAGW